MLRVLVLSCVSVVVADQNCDQLPGNWSGYSGGSLVDRYAVAWAPARGALAFDITLLSNNEPWHHWMPHG